MSLFTPNSKLLALVKKRKSISLTPLIDVVFILLMFFMLTSNFTQWRSINASTAMTGAVDDHTKTYVVALFADHRLALLGSEFSISHYQDLSADDIDYFENASAVVLVPESNVDLQSIVSTLDGLKNVGLPAIVLGESMSLEALAQLQ